MYNNPVDAKADLQTQRAYTWFQTLKRARRFDLTTDKGGNLNTLVPTTVMRPDVTAKRYLHGTRELVEVDSKNSKELVVKGKNMQDDEVVEKVDAKCKHLCLIDW